MSYFEDDDDESIDKILHKARRLDRRASGRVVFLRILKMVLVNAFMLALLYVSVCVLPEIQYSQSMFIFTSVTIVIVSFFVMVLLICSSSE